MHYTMHWRNRFLFIIALIGSAVGLGNIWRFPYVAKEEGFYFILFYLLFVFTIGVVGIFLEIFSGANHKVSLIRIAKEYLKNYYYLVGLSFLSVIVIAGYYTVVSGWTLAFSFLPFLSFYSFKNSFVPLFFSIFVNLSAIAIVNKEFHHGIEAVNKYFVSFLTFFIFVLFIFSFPFNKMDLIIYSLPKKIDLGVIVSALTQALFSLSLGVGLLYTYALFAKPKHLLLSSFSTAFADTAIALMSFVMLMSFSLSMDISFTSPEEFSFVLLKNVFHNYSTYGNIISFIFFFFLFSASYTSVISFYAFLRFNLPKNLEKLIYLPLFISVVVSLDWLFGLDLIYILDRYVIEFILPASMFVNLFVFSKFYYSKTKEQKLPSSKLPMRNNL